MPRKKIVAGNWKMNTTLAEARSLAAAVVKGVGSGTTAEVAVCPPFPWLTAVAEVVKGSPVALGAQDVHFEKKGDQYDPARESVVFVKQEEVVLDG